MHEHKQSRLGLLILLCALLLAMPACASCTYGAENSTQDVTITFTQPSSSETTIAPDRSFYVRGSFSGNAEPVKKVALTMTREGETTAARKIESKYTDMKVDTTAGFPTYWGDASSAESTVSSFGMPDLLYDKAKPDTIHDGDGKCYFDKNGFAILVPNSAEDGMELVQADGTPYAALASGKYTITVTAYGENASPLASKELPVTIGITREKLMARFSPDSHKARITDFAADKKLRVYNDMMPGYWDVAPNFCEIQSEWRTADAAEYQTGNVHFVIYNVKNTSTTYGVELATLQLDRAIDTRLTNYYYQYGEPALTVDGKTVNSEIVPFAKGDKLQFTRAEIGASSSKENTFDQAHPQAKSYDLNLSDGVKAKTGDTLSLYGAAAPIQIDPADISEQNPGTYTGKSYALNNKLASLHYEISGYNVQKKYDKEILLHRVEGTGDYPSELEFRHDIPIAESYAGKTLNVQVTGKDAHGKAVPGTTEKFTITIAAKKGAVIKDKNSNGIYKVTNTKKNHRAVTYQKPKKKSAATIKIPASVKIDGKAYKVTAIAAKAFKNDKKLKKVTASANVKTIGKNAFYGCKNLKKMTIKSKHLTNKHIGKKAFSKIPATAKIDVPNKKIKQYTKLLHAKGLNPKCKIK